MKKSIILYFILFLITPIFSAEVLSNKIIHTKKYFTVGDIVKVEVKIQLKKGEKLKSVEDSNTDGIDIIKKDIKKGKELIISREYQLFALDIKKLPDITLNLKDERGKDYTLNVKGRDIKIKEIARDNKPEDIIPPQKGLNTNWSPLPLILTIIFAILLIGLIYFLIKKLKKREKKEEEPKIWEKEIDPIEFFEKELKRIKDSNYAEKGEFKGFYYDITEVLRKFFSIYYKKNYIDKTTYEFKRDFKEKIQEELKERIFSFLEFSDSVKFAKFNPTEDDIKQAIYFAEEILNYYKKIEESTEKPENVNL